MPIINPIIISWVDLTFKKPMAILNIPGEAQNSYGKLLVFKLRKLLGAGD